MAKRFAEHSIGAQQRAIRRQDCSGIGQRIERVERYGYGRLAHASDQACRRLRNLSKSRLISACPLPFQAQCLRDMNALYGLAFAGLEARPVDVQVQLAGGQPGIVIVGLGDKAITESRERVRAAFTSTVVTLAHVCITRPLSTGWPQPSYKTGTKTQHKSNRNRGRRSHPQIYAQARKHATAKSGFVANSSLSCRRASARATALR
jgi:hypothetical protein